MIRVLVVDDHPVVREGLVAVLEDAVDLEVAGTAGSAEQAIEAVGRLRPDVILLDLELPGMDGTAAIPRLSAVAPETRVIAFTAYDTEERVLSTLEAGARGYLLKGAPADEIIRAIREVHAGGSHLAARVAPKVMAAAGPRRRRGGLTAREREVLRLVAGGRSSKQIARALSVTERTVKFHITSIFNKLGAENRAQAVALATRRGLL
jgi:DNA-binding NarL/FixJ family response regulator